MENCKIFIYTHKDFKELCPITNNDNYSILTEVDLKENYDLPIYDIRTLDNIYYKGRSYSELKGIYWIWKNYKELPKYVGFCHYRRYFEFCNNLPDFDSLFNEVDSVVYATRFTRYDKPFPLSEQYKFFHNIEDLKFCLDYVTNKDISYKPYIDLYIYSNNMFINCCMFIMKREDFISMCEWLFDIFDVYDKYHNTDSEDDYIKYILAHTKEYHLDLFPYKAIYQSRIIAFLGERLIHLWIIKNMNNIRCVDIIKTDDKNKKPSK